MLERMEAADTSASQEEAAALDPAAEPGGFGSLGSILLLLVLTWAAFLALVPLNDNSFFTHLATGRIILDEGSVPSSDPYTYTARGEPWTVQSWLASAAYAGAEQLGGATGLRLLVLAVFLVSAALLWKLTSSVQSVFPRLALLFVALVVATDVWTERPYMVGFIGLAMVWLALEGQLPGWVLVPYMWLWANTHGSFPMASVLCVAVLLGAVLDRRGAQAGTSLRRELRVLCYVALGSALAAVSPLGIRVLMFPMRAITQAGALRDIIEWQAPEFISAADRAMLLLIVVAIAALVASPRWRYMVPMALFSAAAVLAQRNVVMAVPVLVPIIADAAPEVGTLRTRTRPALGGLAALACVALLCIVIVMQFDEADIGLGGYPTRAVAYLGDDPEGRVVSQDLTGNLLEVLDGPTGAVFIDDRADMFPAPALEDFKTLNRTMPRWHAVLDRWDAQLVVWSREHPLGSVLAADARWQIEFSETDWFVARRRR